MDVSRAGKRRPGWVLLVSLSVCTFAAAGCGKLSHKPNELPPDDRLAAKVAHYTELAPEARDYFGAVLAEACDSWHFTALQGAVIGGVDPSAFIDGDGKLHRRPLVGYQECYPDGSASESAKEMYVYGALYALARGDRAWAEGRYEYGEHHQWIMGRGPVTRTLLTENGRAMLAQTIEALGGEKYPDRLWHPKRPLGRRGYEAFAEAVGIAFEGKRFGALSDASIAAVADLASRNPRNAMYACLAARWGQGSLEHAVGLLLDENVFPADRLPTSSDYCERWITQRDDDDQGSWTPCPEAGLTHPPGAFLLSAAICTGSL